MSEVDAIISELSGAPAQHKPTPLPRRRHDA